MIRPRPTWVAVLLTACALALPTLRAGAQSPSAPEVRVRSEENLRKDPNGEVLARVSPGSVLPVVKRQGRWVEVELRGWVWERSLQATDRDGFDLVVSAKEGENLRAAPSGEVVGHLVRGMLLRRAGGRPGWVEVRRRAWIWGASVLDVPAQESPGAADRGGGKPPAGPASRVPAGVVSIGAGGGSILAAPGGDTVAVVRPGTDLEVAARQGRWARVRLEGWAWLPPSDSASEGAAHASEPPTPADLKADPSAYVGRMVTWRVQFISLERAEKVRTDFFEGEPFLLVRYGEVNGPFVYVAVPPSRVGEVEGLVPLEWLRVTGRIRTGSSALTGTPIVDLVSFQRVRARP